MSLQYTDMALALIFNIYLIGLTNFQACEQLNSWLSGFESILKQMKIGNFDWFLHTMLFLLEL